MLVAAALLIGCHNAAPYSGDGKLIDYGVSDPNHRYILDLGPVKLDQDHQYVYTLKNLPVKNFVFGFEIKLVPPNKQFLDQRPINCSVKFRIEDENGIKLSEVADIRDWVWSGLGNGESVFIYRRDNPGTYFTPEERKSYKLIIDITNANKTTTYPIKLIGTTAGWK